MADSLDEAHLQSEWEQAWAHYRHLEASRAQYLGFVFTVLLASLTVAVTVMKDMSRKPALFGLVALAALVFLVTLTVYVLVKKNRYVMWRYDEIIQTVRRRRGYSSSKELPFKMSDLKGCPAYISDPRGPFGVGRSVELLLVMLTAILLTLLGLLTVYAWRLDPPLDAWQRYAVAATSVACLLIAVSVTEPVARRLHSRRVRSREG